MVMPMITTAFISSSDHNYFPMLWEWVHSIRSFPQSKAIDICILDAGLKSEQVQILEKAGCIVKDAQWPCELPSHKIAGKDYLKSCICRPFIPDYFPDYDRYFWMDADTWVQNWRGVEMFLKGAENGAIALTAQTDRAYARQVRIKWIGNIPRTIRGFYISNAPKAFGWKTAKQLYQYQVLLAGAFALNREAPHWKRWQTLMLQALKKGKIFTAEQLSLGVLCHLEGYDFELLPAYIHWLCEYKPQINQDSGKFVEPYLPNEEIGILHLSGWDGMRLDRSITTDFETLDGQSLSRSYRYPDFDGETSS